MNKTPGRNKNYHQNNYYRQQNSNSSNNVFNPKIPDKYIITIRNVKEAFKLFAIDQKYLNIQAFDDALEYLFSKLPIPVLHHTYLSKKLFNIFNLSGDSKLNEEQFLICIKEILSNQNNRLHLSMMAMMTCPNKVRKTVELDELKEYFYKSFVQGYKHMAYKINQNPDKLKIYGFPVASVAQMEAWAIEFERKIKTGFEKDLKMFDSSINENISFEQYKKWIYNDQTLNIAYGFVTLKIATSLICFDEVILKEN